VHYVEASQADWVLTLALKTPPKRRMSAEWWLLDDHKSGPLQVSHDSPGDDKSPQLDARGGVRSSLIVRPSTGSRRSAGRASYSDVILRLAKAGS